MTADKLVAALLASFQAKLDAAVAAGDLTAAQESAGLANLRLKLKLRATMPFDE